MVSRLKGLLTFQSRDKGDKHIFPLVVWIKLDLHETFRIKWFCTIASRSWFFIGRDKVRPAPNTQLSVQVERDWSATRNLIGRLDEVGVAPSDLAEGWGKVVCSKPFFFSLLYEWDRVGFRSFCSKILLHTRP